MAAGLQGQRLEFGCRERVADGVEHELFARPDAEIDANAVLVEFGMAVKPDGIAADRIFNRGGEIARCVEQGDHESDGTANIEGIENGRVYDAAVDAGDGDNLDPEAIVELIGKAGCQVLLVGGFQIPLYLYAGGENERAAEGVFAAEPCRRRAKVKSLTPTSRQGREKEQYFAGAAK